MHQRWVRWALSICFAFTFAVLLTGCREETTEEPCTHVNGTKYECSNGDVVCQGALERVEYVVSPKSRHARAKINTLLRLQDGSSCLLDESVDPQWFNGIPTGAPIKLYWKGVLEKEHLPCGQHWYFQCTSVLTLETSNQVEIPPPK